MSCEQGEMKISQYLLFENMFVVYEGYESIFVDNIRCLTETRCLIE